MQVKAPGGDKLIQRVFQKAQFPVQFLNAAY